jgi:hypothetical protein
MRGTDRRSLPSVRAAPLECSCGITVWQTAADSQVRPADLQTAGLSSSRPSGTLAASGSSPPQPTTLVQYASRRRGKSEGRHEAVPALARLRGRDLIHLSNVGLLGHPGALPRLEGDLFVGLDESSGV